MAAIAASGLDKYTSESMAELDSHKNMIVLGNQALFIQDTGKSAEVNEFSSNIQGMSKLPVVDAVVTYNCTFSSESYLLVMQNDLHIPSIKYNLIPPFIIREAGLTVSKVPNIHCNEPTVEDHTIYDYVTKLRIPLNLDGISLYLPIQPLTLEDMERCNKIEHVFLSPDAETWDPYSDTFDLN